MNAHIQKLIEECTERHYVDMCDNFDVVFNKEKFAELIVTECARIAEEADDTMTNQGVASARAFKEYFGIK